MMHKQSSELAGKTVKISAGVIHPQFEKFGGEDYRIEDYWDKVSGKSWVLGAEEGNMACVIYAMRVGISKLPWDDNVFYGKVGPFGHLVHQSEIELPTE